MSKVTRQKSTLDEDVFTLALQRMRAIYDRFDKVVVSFSGGKDSTAAMQVALIVARELDRLPLDVYTFDEEAIPPETVEYMARVAQNPEINFQWFCLPLEHRNACSRKQPYWYTWDPDQKDKWVRPLPPNAITELEGLKRGDTAVECVPLIWPKKFGTVCSVMGIRCQESLTRLRAITMKKSADFVYLSPSANPMHKWIKKGYPIYDWMVGDVWQAAYRFGWDYNCNPYEAPIWMADYTFKPIGEIKAGDQIIGWNRDETPTSRRGKPVPNYSKDRLTKATVLEVHSKIKPTIKIVLESGAIIRCTADHQWLTVSKNRNKYTFEIPAIGNEICRVVDIPEPILARDEKLCGWLAGIYDGEGCGDRLYQSDSHNPAVYAAIEAALTQLEVSFTKLNGRTAAQKGFRISSGRAGLAKFLNVTQPVRRGRQVDELMLGNKFRKPDRIVSIEPDATEAVYALTTTTGNYVCWGYASKNSAYDLMEASGMSRLEARCSPSFGEQSNRRLGSFKVCWPDLWARMVDRVHGAATAARYANTELYGIAVKDSDLPFGLSWQEHIRNTLNMLDDKTRAELSAKVQTIIRQHKKLSKAPLPDDEPDNRSGFCWKTIYPMIAAGGDKFDRQSQKIRHHALESRRKQGCSKNAT